MRTSILIFAAFLLPLSAFTQTGRRYIPRDTFAQFNSDKCFDLTREEGDRAFRAKDWETAAALFRAAKNCADADQKKRIQMSQRIGDSRKAAIAELVEKEREATRIARQAIATNRGNDAMLLLKDGHRSLAFRLADFGDRYIAPDGEPNTNCRQAMLDAWNYIPYYHSWMRDAPDLRVPFCFQLAENLCFGTKLCYQQRISPRLYAFSPDEHLLRWWNSDLTQAVQPIRMDTALTSFEVSPDGQTLLFYSKRRLVLWRSPTNFYPIETSGTAFCAFSATGDVFYYLDRSQIRAVKMSKVGASRGNRTYQRNLISNIGEVLNQEEYTGPQVETTGLLGFAVKGADVYLAYPDRVLVAKSDTTLICPMPYTLPGDVQPDQVKFWLKENLLTYANDTLFIRFKLPGAAGGSVVQETAYGEQPVAFSPQMLATRERSNAATDGRIFFRETPNAITHFSRNDIDVSRNDRWLSGAMSLDGTRCAALLSDNTLRVFELEKQSDGAVLPYFKTAHGQHLQFTPNGEHFVTLGTKSLEVFSMDDRENAVSVRPIKSTEPTLAIGNSWVAYRSAEDSVELLQFQTDSSWRLPVKGQSAIALSGDERLFAYSQGSEVRVMDLSGTAQPLVQDLGAEITDLLFVPNSTKLMITVGTYSFDLHIKFWDFAQPDREPEVLLLSGFTIVSDNTTPVAISPDGRWVALNSSTGIHIFELSNLTEEYNLLRAPNKGEATVSTMTFSPDGLLLVMGYSDGHTIAWDIATRRMVYRLAPPTTRPMPVAHLHFSDDGLQLHQVLLPAVMKHQERSSEGDDADDDHRSLKNDSTYWTTTNTFTARLLDFDEMRLHLSEGTRQLVAFSPNQILDYDLESALSYSGNFERLAQSGDLPLIRSFFDFYQQQAYQSNNSAQVRQSCDRAFQLYQNLDPANRESLRDRMLGMYNDLIWKLIQRNKPDEASIAVQHVSRNFGQLLDLVRWNGHIALLRGENHLKTAVNRYVDWIVGSAEAQSTNNEYFGNTYGTLAEELRKLNTYGLLRDGQKQMICGLFNENKEVLGDGFCPINLPTTEADVAGATSGKMAIESSLDPINRQRWHIFQGLSRIDLTTSFSEKTRLLEGYLEDAKKLARQNPAYRTMLERTALELARTHIAHGDFEQGNDRALRLYAQAARTVQDIAPFKKYAAENWDVRSNVNLLTGNIQRQRGNIAGATQAYQECQKALENFQTAATNSPDRWMWEENIRTLLGETFTQLGMVRLLENRPDDADTLFENANRVLSGGLPQRYIGHAAMLRGNRVEAFLNYGDISDAAQLGQAFAEIERMAEHIPTRREELVAFSNDLRQAAFAAKTDIDSVAAQYFYADFQTRHFAAMRQWNEAQKWSREVLRGAKKLREGTTKDANDWESSWFEAHLSAAYYHLFAGSRDTAALTAAIQYSLAAEKRLAEGAAYANADYLKTNLAHALLLRNGAGDRKAALQEYRAFLTSDTYASNYWDLLQKDFRDLQDAGVQWPADMPQVMEQIREAAKPAEKN